MSGFTSKGKYSKSSEAYAQRQANKDHCYRQDYRDWISRLTEAEIQILDDLGVGKPKISYHAKGGPKLDPADSPAASFEPDIAAIVDRDYEKERAHPQARDVYDVLRYFIAEVLCHDNTRLTVECFALALGLSAYQGESMSDIARRHGICPAAVSKRCVQITEEYDIPPSRAMRSVKARTSCTKASIKRNSSDRYELP